MAFTEYIAQTAGYACLILYRAIQDLLSLVGFAFVFIAEGRFGSGGV